MKLARRRLHSVATPATPPRKEDIGLGRDEALDDDGEEEEEEVTPRPPRLRLSLPPLHFLGPTHAPGHTMDTKSPTHHRSLLGKVKHLLRSPRAEKFSDGAAGEGHEAGEGRKAGQERLSPSTPVSTEVYEALGRLPNESTPRVVVHSPHAIAVVEEEDGSDDGGTYRPTIRKRGSDTIRPSVSRPTTATSARHFPLVAYADAEVQAPDVSRPASPTPDDQRIAQLESALLDAHSHARALEGENDDLRRQLADATRELEAAQLELMISEKFIETIKQENRELLMDIASGSGGGGGGGQGGGGSLNGWGEADRDSGYGYGFYSGSAYGSDVPTRPTSVASSFDAASFLSSGAWSAPPQTQVRAPVARTTSGSSAPPGVPVPIAERERRKTPELSVVSLPLGPPIPPPAPPLPPSTTTTTTAHNHHRRATTTSISSSSSSSQQPPAAPAPATNGTGTRKLGPTRRDSMTSLRRTSHSHTPTQPSPLALDAMTNEPEDVDMDIGDEGPGQGREEEGEGEGERERGRGRGERSASVLSENGLPTPSGSSPALSRTSTLASDEPRSPVKEVCGI